MAEEPFLRKVPLFMEFDADELAAIGPLFREHGYEPGALILEEGMSNRALHVVRRGRVRVSRHLEDDEVTLCDLTEGQTFGELSIVEDGVTTARLRAIPDTTILSISMNELARFINEHPRAGVKFWRALSLDLRKRLLQTNDVVRNYFEINKAIVENATFREAYALCNR
jgi:CRP/FNR family transcriptional regulator, cyclic AMP receptor protein